MAYGGVPADRRAKKPVRFPDDDELRDLLEDAAPLAERQAARNGLELETWMFADAICRICPEIKKCDQVLLEEAVERVLKDMGR